MTKFAGHGFDVKDITKVEKVYMNVRHPVTRLASWYRLLKVNSPELNFNDWIRHLVTGDCKFTNNIVSADTNIFPVPMYRYIDMLGDMPDALVRIESLEEDLEAVGFPIRNHEFDSPKEPQIDFTYDELLAHEYYCDIIHAVYGRDFEVFNYT